MQKSYVLIVFLLLSLFVIDGYAARRDNIRESAQDNRRSSNSPLYSGRSNLSPSPRRSTASGSATTGSSGSTRSTASGSISSPFHSTRNSRIRPQPKKHHRPHFFPKCPFPSHHCHCDCRTKASELALAASIQLSAAVLINAQIVAAVEVVIKLFLDIQLLIKLGLKVFAQLLAVATAQIDIVVSLSAKASISIEIGIEAIVGALVRIAHKCPKSVAVERNIHVGLEALKSAHAVIKSSTLLALKIKFILDLIIKLVGLSATQLEAGDIAQQSLALQGSSFLELLDNDSGKLQTNPFGYSQTVLEKMNTLNGNNTMLSNVLLKMKDSIPPIPSSSPQS